MKKYLTIFKIGFQDAVAYRGKLLIYVLQNMLWIVILPFVWFAIYKQNTTIAEFDVKMMMSYFYFMPLVEIITVSYIYDAVHSEIKNGGIARFLVKPLNYVLYCFSEECGWKPLRGFFIIAVMLAIFPLVQPFLAIPTPSLRLLLLPVVFILGIILFFQIAMIVGLVSFWTTQGSWIKHFWWVLSTFTMGYLAPITFYPEYIQKIFGFTPFPLLLQTPLRILLDTISTAQVERELVVGLVWFGIFFLIIRLMWKRGSRRVDIVGM